VASSDSELFERYRRLSDGELESLLFEGSSQYTERAWTLLREEAARRGFKAVIEPLTDRRAVVPGPPARPTRPRTVFVVVLVLGVLEVLTSWVLRPKAAAVVILALVGLQLYVTRAKYQRALSGLRELLDERLVETESPFFSPTQLVGRVRGRTVFFTVEESGEGIRRVTFRIAIVCDVPAFFYVERLRPAVMLSIPGYELKIGDPELDAKFFFTCLWDPTFNANRGWLARLLRQPGSRQAIESLLDRYGVTHIGVDVVRHGPFGRVMPSVYTTSGGAGDAALVSIDVATHPRIEPRLGQPPVVLQAVYASYRKEYTAVRNVQAVLQQLEAVHEALCHA